MCKKLICLMSLVLLLVMSSLVFAQTYPGKIGVGIGMGWNLPFVDAAKTLRAFENTDRTPAATDSQGWPTTDAITVLWDMRPIAPWEGSIDDPERHFPNVSGTYKCSFNGQATLSIFEGNFSTANQVYDSGTNTTAFDLIVPTDADEWNNVVFISFTDTKRTSESATNTGITNLKAIRPGYPADTTQIFHTPFIDAINSASFSTWRAMGWVSANNTNLDYPQQVEWSERKLWTDATQETWGDKLEGGCWETVIWLSNEAGIDPWITIPIHASDDYITQLATLFKDNLNADRNVYVEWSNEVWNFLFWQTNYNNLWGQALGLSNVEHYAKRTAEISNIFKSVWGASAINDRVRVMNCWYDSGGLFQQQMNYINNNFGPPSQIIYAIASANYLDVRDTGLLEYGTAQEILDGMWAKSDSWVPYRQAAATVAGDWTLPGGHCAYEGGSDTGGGSTMNLPNRLAAERSAGMMDLMIHDLRDNWFPHDGQLFMCLELTSGYNRYGCWGLTDDVTDPDRNYKFAAVRNLLGDPQPPPGKATNPSPPDWAANVPTSEDLSWTAGSRAASHDVYFGVDPTPDSSEFKGNQTGTTYDPGTLANDTTYYWRIDGKNETGTTTGDVWSFTTMAEGVRTMNVIIAADDGYDLYVNGEFIGSGATWTTAQTYNWIELLAGENVVAVRGVDAYLAEGVLAELIIDANRVGTDTSWKVSLSPGTGWESPGFDDSGWANASDRGAYGGDPWGTGVAGMPTDTPAHWIWSAGAESPVYLRYSFTLGPPVPPGQASNPSPADAATDQSVDVDLSWSAGSGATSHDVYFGTSSPGEFQGNQTSTTFDPGTMANDTTYYWRIDEKNAEGTTTGTVWSFTTEATTPPPGQASNPSPANGATSVNINADVSWTAGSGATSHDVYFGQTSPGTFQGNQTSTTFDPGTMANDTTYYWRIDEKNASSTTTGTVWSFTTEAAGAAVTITVNPAVQYQLIQGWGACAGMSVVATDTRAQAAYRNLGMNLLRVAIEPCILMAPGGDLWSPFVELTADIDENITKFNFEHSRYWYWDDVVEWLAANALEPERVKIHGSCWSPPNWAKAPTGLYVDTGAGAGLTPFVAYCNECDSVGGTWDDGTFNWNAYQYCSRFLAAWCKGFSQHAGGVPIYGLSIQNEVGFESPFNSCTLYHKARSEQIEQDRIFDPNIYANALKAVKDEFALHPELASVEIFGPDHAGLDENPANPWGLLWQTLGVQAVKDHTDPELINFLGTYSHNYSAPAAKRAEMFNAHWEGIDSMPGENWAAWDYPASMHAGIGGDGKQVWNEEFGGHFPTSWTNMLDMAGDLHCQLVWGHESAIIHWAFCEDTLTQHNLLATSQLDNPEQSMKYSTFKQFSRYIRPGAKCVDATFSDGSTSYGGANDMDVENALNVSAYIHETDGRVTIVFVNMKASSEAVTINVPTSPDVTTYSVYRSTSSDRFAQQPDLNVSGGQVSLTVPAQSIVTLTGTGPVTPQPPGQASNPSPADAATDVSVDADISWTAGSGADSHDVYFGQTTSPPFVQNQAGTIYDPGTMAEATTHYWRIDEKNAEGTTTGVVWSFTTGAVDTTPPAAPTGLTATAGDTTVDLDWADNTEPDLSHYNVKRSTTTGGPYTQIATNVTVSAYTDTGLTNGTTYYYVVTAVDTSSNESGNSNEASATPTGPPPPPGQLLVWDLVGVSGSASSTADVFDPDISATAPSGVASIASGLTPGFPSFAGLVAYNLNANTLAEAKANNEYFSWTITPESGYQMSLTSIDLRALSQNTLRTFNLLSSVDGFTTSIGYVTSDSTSPTLQTINITGHDNLTGAVEFRLYVYPSVNTYETLGIGDMTGNDLIVNGTTGTAGPPDTTPPADPTGLTATAGDSQVSLDWADNTEPDLSHYNVKRSTTAGGSYTQIATNVTVSSYTDTGLTNGTTYYYVVTAVDTSSNESGNSNEASATPEGIPDTTPPAAPTGLAATAGDAQVSLDWADNTEPDLSHYNVKRSTTAGGSYTQIATNVTVSAYTDTGLTNGTTYYYVVTAVDTSSNESGNSNEASATPQAGPPPPEQQLLVWDLDGAGGSASSTADVFDPDISATAPSGVASIGSGLIPYGASFDGLVAYFLNANNLNQAKTNDEYFSWTITPESGCQMSLTSIDLRALSQNTSRTFNLFSSVDGFTTSIGSVTSSSTSPTLQTINVTGHDNLTGAVEFRLYVYPGENLYETLGIGDMTGDDLIVNGTTN